MAAAKDCRSLPFCDAVAELLSKAEKEARRRGAASALLTVLCEQVLPQGSAESPVPDFFEVLRLLLPQHDPRRYNLKEAALAPMLAAELPSHTEAMKDWRTGRRDGAGNFAALAYTEVLTRIGARSKRLTVGEVNDILNALAEAQGSKAKQREVTRLLTSCSPLEMKYLIMIILKDIKVAGVTQRNVFRAFHPSAEEVFNLCSSLESVCSTLNYRAKKLPRQGISIGKAVKPQKAARTDSCEQAFARLSKSGPFVVENKFDGWRIQLHRDGDTIQYFSRNAMDHGEMYSFSGFDDAIRAQVIPQRVILDGELVVWNKVKKNFEPFNVLTPAFDAIRKGMKRGTRLKADYEKIYTANPDYVTPSVEDVEIMYVAFDIIYLNDCAINDLPLKERHTKLEAALRPGGSAGTLLGGGGITGRVHALVPGPGAEWTEVGTSLEDIQSFFDAAMLRQEEGIVAKSLGSTWEPNDRTSHSWLKVKPDYITQQDMDALIIGAYYGTGVNGGKVSQYLLGIAVPNPAGGCPNFVTFTKVGTGLSADERKKVRDTLAAAGVLVDAKEHPAPPPYLQAVDSARVKPHVWITDPEKSVVVEIQADLRLIQSKMFASGYSLRFPRIRRIREDKSCREVMTLQELTDMVEENKGNLTANRGEYSRKRQPQRKATTAAAGGVSSVVDAYKAPDVSGVERESDALEGCRIHALDYEAVSKEELAALVKEMGGQMWMSYAPSVTHVVASPGIRNSKQHLRSFQTVQRDPDTDILSVQWLRDCHAAGRSRVPLKPRHFLHMSSITRSQLANTDRCGDDLTAPVDVVDVAALMQLVHKYPPYEAAQRFACGLGLSSQKAYESWQERHEDQDAVVPHPELVYQHSGWTDWAHWLGTAGSQPRGRKSAKRPSFWPFEAARAWVQRDAGCRALRGAEDWRAWVQAGHLPLELPSEPWRTYAGRGWVSWEDWLHGSGVAAPPNKELQRLMMDVDAELAGAGVAGLAPLRGTCCCAVAVSDEPPAPGAATAEERLPSTERCALEAKKAESAYLQAQRRQISVQVKLGGGLWCEPAMAMECSHVFACAIMPLAWEPEPRQRLRRLVASLRQAGADDAALLGCHKQLLAGRWHAVTPSWLDKCASNAGAHKQAPELQEDWLAGEGRRLACDHALWGDLIPGAELELLRAIAQGSKHLVPEAEHAGMLLRLASQMMDAEDSAQLEEALAHVEAAERMARSAAREDAAAHGLDSLAAEAEQAREQLQRRLAHICEVESCVPAAAPGSAKKRRLSAASQDEPQSRASPSGPRRGRGRRGEAETTLPPVVKRRARRAAGRAAASPHSQDEQMAQPAESMTAVKASQSRDPELPQAEPATHTPSLPAPAKEEPVTPSSQAVVGSWRSKAAKGIAPIKVEGSGAEGAAVQARPCAEVKVEPPLAVGRPMPKFMRDVLEDGAELVSSLPTAPVFTAPTGPPQTCATVRKAAEGDVAAASIAPPPVVSPNALPRPAPALPLAGAEEAGAACDVTGNDRQPGPATSTTAGVSSFGSAPRVAEPGVKEPQKKRTYKSMLDRINDL